MNKQRLGAVSSLIPGMKRIYQELVGRVGLEPTTNGLAKLSSGYGLMCPNRSARQKNCGSAGTC